MQIPLILAAFAIFLFNVAQGSSWVDVGEDENYVGRGEGAFLQAGDKFYVFGGFESRVVEEYDYLTNTWDANPVEQPLMFNHLQAVEYQGLIWVIGAMKTDDFPVGIPVEYVYAYDPVKKVWMQGPEIPRKRGASALVVHQDKFYMLCGNTVGHGGGHVKWLDEFDPQTNTWNELPNAPNARDHVHAAVLGDKLYVAGGRKSTQPWFIYVHEVDVFDFNTQTWTTMENPIPTVRAGTSAVAFQDQFIVIGGETIRGIVEGQPPALDTVESLDPTTGDWMALPSLNHGRHATQAFVSGDGIFIASGSPVMAGGSFRKMEAYNSNNPNGNALESGMLTIEPASLVTEGSGASFQIELSNTGGNQGIYVNAMNLDGSDEEGFDFEFDSTPNDAVPLEEPFLILSNTTRYVYIKYTGDSTATSSDASALLNITYNEQVFEPEVIGKKQQKRVDTKNFWLKLKRIPLFWLAFFGLV